jgi:hypothetical protein
LRPAFGAIWCFRYGAASDNATDTADKKGRGLGISGYRDINQQIIHPQHPQARFDRFAHGKKKAPGMKMVL